MNNEFDLKQKTLVINEDYFEEFGENTIGGTNHFNSWHSSFF